MILYSVEARDALLIPTPNIPHLFTVITDPWPYDDSGNSVIMVNISSIKRNRPYDGTCVIRADESANRFITCDSYVIYQFAELRKESQIISLREQGLITPYGTMSKECYERMASGIQRSENTPEEIKAAYRDYLRFRLL